MPRLLEAELLSPVVLLARELGMDRRGMNCLRTERGHISLYEGISEWETIGVGKS